MWQNRSVGHPEVALDQWHHFYLGVAIAAAGLWLRMDWLRIVAAIVCVDDAVQHVVQVSGHADYHSPLRQLFAWLLWPFEPVRWLVGVLNEVFK